MMALQNCSMFWQLNILSAGNEMNVRKPKKDNPKNILQIRKNIENRYLLDKLQGEGHTSL